MTKTRRGFIPLLMAILALASLLLLAYGYLQSSVAERKERAQQLEAEGKFEEALTQYQELVEHVAGLGFLGSQFREEYSTGMVGQLRLLYQLQRYDEGVELADICIQEEISDMAAAYFWSGNAFFQKGINEPAMEDAFAWFNRARDQYRKSLERDTEQRWNIRFNYELVRTALEQAEQSEEEQPMKILRPRDQIQQPDARIIG